MKSIVDSLLGKPCSRSPLWLMRQAGRYLPEYRSFRKNFPQFMDMCLTPEAIVEITLMPLRRFDFDAAILFSDILVVPYALGQDVHFDEGIGPVLSPLDVDRLDLSTLNEKLMPVYEGVRSLKPYLPEHVTFIGFSGAPWTLATYMVEGGTSRSFSKTFEFALSNPDKFSQLLSTLSQSIIVHLLNQIRCGVDVVQIFDSWAGVVPDCFFTSWVIQPLKEAFLAIRKEFPQIPIIYFPKNCSSQYQKIIAELSPTALSIDSSVSIETMVSLHISCGTQGNLDPLVLRYGDQGVIEKEVTLLKNLSLTSGRHIINLGHGILPDTPLENVEKMLSIVRS